MTKLDTCECPVCGNFVEWDWSTQEALEDFLLWLCKRLLLRALDGSPADVRAELLPLVQSCQDPAQLKALIGGLDADASRSD